MTTLRVVVDQIVAPVAGGVGRYSEELTREIIASAPPGCDVEGIVSAVSKEKVDLLESKLPGLAALHRTTLPRRELSAAWQLGIVTPGAGNGMVHAPGLLAPLSRHDRMNDGNQIVVTIHDTLAWSHPSSLTPLSVSWQKAMVKRARKHADAIVVPTHAVADELRQIIDLGDRVRVIGGAAASTLALPTDADGRARTLDLPSEYLVSVGSLDPRRGITELITGLGRPGAPDLPLLIVGTDSWGDVTLAQVADEAGLPEGRVRALGFLDDADLAVVLDRATALVYPSLAEGFGLPLVEAFRFGTPVIHSDVPALVEVGGGAGVVVESGAKGYADRLIATINDVIGDSERLARLRILGMDREQAFSWRDSAERVWQLHAEI
ncbi:glycosyltransferase family 1 protein [Plantibacter sp. M259]|uniref:glycosyltransferase family 4 protein n=1 Tax=Plantibacter sp. M259 TaxID=2583822 RepID=UPI001110C842|nr:glycosyltransferase family 1 protein [Plantibacter sp. M259]